MLERRLYKMEFVEAYAKRSGVSVTELREHNRVVIHCDCGEDLCEGWQMVPFDGNPILLKAVGVWKYARERYRVTYQWHCRVCGVDGRARVANWRYIRSLGLAHCKKNHWLEDK